MNQYAVGGIVYFSKNIQSGEQLSKMIENTILFSKYPIFIGVDEEGGNVSRIGGAGLAEKVDSAQNIAATGDAANAYQAGNTIGTYLKKLGFSVDFAPVADLANVENSIMTGRGLWAGWGNSHSLCHIHGKWTSGDWSECLSEAFSGSGKQCGGYA